MAAPEYPPPTYPPPTYPPSAYPQPMYPPSAYPYPPGQPMPVGPQPGAMPLEAPPPGAATAPVYYAQPGMPPPTVVAQPVAPYGYPPAPAVVIAQPAPASQGNCLRGCILACAIIILVLGITGATTYWAYASSSYDSSKMARWFPKKLVIEAGFVQQSSEQNWDYDGSNYKSLKALCTTYGDFADAAGASSGLSAAVAALSAVHLVLTIIQMSTRGKYAVLGVLNSVDAVLLTILAFSALGPMDSACTKAKNDRTLFCGVSFAIYVNTLYCFGAGTGVAVAAGITGIVSSICTIVDAVKACRRK